MSVRILRGDALAMLKTLPDCSVDSVVTDPPYGLSFMGKRWDYDVPPVEVWVECLRVLKPGGHLLAFAGTRTQHRMCVRIEDAGFEIRDMIAWVYGSGFPKSLDVSKAIDKAAGVERVITRPESAPYKRGTKVDWDSRGSEQREQREQPATAEALAWQGWGTALKPAMEPITLARKPLIGTVAANVLAHRLGAVNIDACRVAYESQQDKQAAAAAAAAEQRSRQDKRNTEGWGMRAQDLSAAEFLEGRAGLGRWPANLIHDGSADVLAAFPDAAGQQGAICGAEPSARTNEIFGDFGPRNAFGPRGDAGSAARFFYCAKASKEDRNEGLEGLEGLAVGDGRKVAADNAYQRGKTLRQNTHPTVKPTDLMRYLCRLVTPSGGIVLDPYLGSGSTGKAAVLEGFQFIGIEREAEYVALAEARIDFARKLPMQGSLQDAYDQVSRDELKIA